MLTKGYDNKIQTSSLHLKRKIYFYVLTWKNQDNDDVYLDQNFLIKVLRSAGLHSKLVLQEDEIERVEIIPDSIKHHGDNVVAYKLKRIRKKDIPLEENDETGDLYPYNPDTKRVFNEPTHLITVNGKFIISELNVNSVLPRSTLWKAINEGLKKAKENGDNNVLGNEIKGFTINQVPNENFRERIKTIQRVKRMEIKVASGYGNVLKQGKNSIIRRLNIPKSVEKSRVTLIFSAGRKKEVIKNLTRAFKRFSRSIIEGEEFQEEFLESLLVVGLTKEGEEKRVNLVEDFLKTEVIVTKMSERRAVESGDMYEKLTKSFEDNRSYLEKYTFT